ncbi:dynein axonemal heavy chain 7-like [Ischnura elegans]|uniref:dynein axonemal heavy chain 7-like n=1 Tax=Ischnura elegans TaxID=197161 RepID=UPI001ED8B3FB|nr:dynein axonemal heavy chain 7-like [Ischnura elegans]
MDKQRRKTPKRQDFLGKKSSPEMNSLPSDLFTPPKHLNLCKKPKLRHQYRPGEPMPNSKSDGKKRLSPLALLRKERENFRKKLVKIILQGDSKCNVDELDLYKDGDGTDQQIPNKEEQMILRYYYYIHHGIDTIHVAPIEVSWLKNIYGLVPLHLKNRWATLVDELTDEIREDFLIAVKKAVVDFVLQDPAKGVPNLKVCFI